VTQNYLYVHLDTISNSVLFKGITLENFYQSIARKPQNLLLLDPHSKDGEYDLHTGFRIIRNAENVDSFFASQSSQRISELKWIDFHDVHFLQQLTPMEIAELLYFGHVGTQLHSPFFYKLQNNFVYFEKGNQMIKIYFRHLDEFYQLLGNKIQGILSDKLNERRSFFRRPIAVEPLSEEFLKGLKEIYVEGVVFDFSQLDANNKFCQIPIYVVEDQVRYLDKQIYLDEMKIGTLTYDHPTRQWEVKKEAWDSLGSFGQV